MGPQPWGPRHTRVFCVWWGRGALGCVFLSFQAEGPMHIAIPGLLFSLEERRRREKRVARDEILGKEKRREFQLLAAAGGRVAPKGAHESWPHQTNTSSPRLCGEGCGDST